MFMNRSRRGAAQVSVVWVVVFVVLFLAAGLFGFSAQGKEKAAHEEAARYKAQSEADIKAKDEARAKFNELSKRVGWSDPASAAAATDLTILQKDFDEFRTGFPDMGQDVTTLAAALPAAKNAYAARVKEIETLKTTKASLEGEKKSMEDGLREALAQKDTAIDNLQKQLADEQNTASQKQAELEGRVASLNTQTSTLDAQLRESRGTSEKSTRAFEQERQAAQTREKSILGKLAFMKEPEAADGKVLQVSKDVALGWIDIGSNDRVQRGMRFHIVSGKTGSTTIKGMAEVTQVKPEMAEVSFYEITDRFDPIVAGDVIYNPLFDPTGERNAVLAGRFSGQFNEAELKILLAKMNIKVQPALAFDTDYLIVGSEMYVDESGQPLEEPLKPQDLAVYKNAEAKGVNIISINQLRTYFKF
jgi:hypothetical protein